MRALDSVKLLGFFLIGISLGAGMAIAQAKPVLLTSGQLRCIDHECPEGTFSVEKFYIMVPRDGAIADTLRSLRDQVVRITLERVEPRTLEVIR